MSDCSLLLSPLWESIGESTLLRQLAYVKEPTPLAPPRPSQIAARWYELLSRFFNQRN